MRISGGGDGLCLECDSVSLVTGKGPFHKEQVHQKPIGSKARGQLMWL